MNNFLKALLILIIPTILLTGCVTKKACERKFPPITETITVIKDTTIYIPQVSHDTIIDFRNAVVFDTVVIDGVGIKDPIIRYVKLPGDSIWIDAECPADTIVVEKTVTTTNKTSYQVKGHKFWPPFLMGAGIFILLFFVYKAVRTYLKAYLRL